MDFKPGTKNAIVGSTGSGKTTILSLIGRLYELDSGTICFNGQDISKLSISSVRDQITIVSQDIVIFDQSLEDNIRYANPLANKEMIIEAAKKAKIDKLLLQKEKKLRLAQMEVNYQEGKTTDCLSSRFSKTSTYFIIRRSNLCT